MILACPACDSRYDVTGHAVGQKFRCRCGQMMALEALPPVAGELACPHCGGGVSPTASACGYCTAELLMKACPRCLSRVFHGHKHCPECGAELALAATAEAYA
ncbi:MAG TPA: zinc ribbon domain-containing protein, partial [Kofleriaceae bacterium]|nr:zinc ribbon domain-containing protein [Kofleriaceae bacterium]